MSEVDRPMSKVWKCIAKSIPINHIGHNFSHFWLLYWVDIPELCPVAFWRSSFRLPEFPRALFLAFLSIFYFFMTCWPRVSVYLIYFVYSQKCASLFDAKIDSLWDWLSTARRAKQYDLSRTFFALWERESVQNWFRKKDKTGVGVVETLKGPLFRD